ncbi:MAG: BatA domain-containing protein [Bacteroidales bacterium]
MEFVNPFFLFGLLAIGVPILIHLFNFRKYKRIYFTNVRFLRELKEQTKKRSKLRHLIILLLRIFAIAFLAIAFAQPYIPFSKNKVKADSRNAVSIYVDNSFSMQAMGIKGPLLEEARQKAHEIATAYKSTDVFQILTNDFEGKHQRLVSRDEFYRMLSEITVTPVSRKLSEVVSRQKDLLTESGVRMKSAFIVSDFQQNFTNISSLVDDSTKSFYLMPLAASQVNNLYIDSCWFDSPVQQAGFPARLHVKISNSSTSDFEKIPLKLTVNNTQKAVASIDVVAGSSVEIIMPFINYKGGICQGILEINDYPITYDDHFYFSYVVTDAMSVLSIDGKEGNAFLNALFLRDSSVVYKHMQEKKLDYSDFENYNLIILNEVSSISTGLAQELKRFIENGGCVTIIPPATAELASYNAFLQTLNAGMLAGPDTAKTQVSKINLNHPVFSDVFEESEIHGKLPDNVELPTVFSHFRIMSNSRIPSESLMSMQDGDELLTVQPVGEGMIYILASPLDVKFNNFPKQALFVPVFYNMALLSRPSPRLYYSIGRDELVRISGERLKDDQVYTIRSNSSDFDFIPGKVEQNSVNFVQVHDQLKGAGNYTVFVGDQKVMGLSYNYNRSESDLKYFTSNELSQMLEKEEIKNIRVLAESNKAVGEAITELNLGKRLWKYFVFAALLFLLTEVILIRLWKT